jgi:hypothetical protein
MNQTPAEVACAALRPYHWRGFTPDLLARWVLAARDREQVHRLLAEFSGAAVGAWDALVPADRDDVRVGALVRFLACHRWTELSLSTVCAQLLGLLDPET